MQNHMPWAGWYDDPVPVTGPVGDSREAVGTYLRGLEYSDDALSDFLRALRSSSERTVVVFYGDHLPAVYDDGVLDAEPTRTRYETPFLVWDSAGNTARPQPLTSAGHLLPLLYDVVDAPLPPYIALIEQLRRRLPAVTREHLVTAAGEEIAGEDALPPATQRLLGDLRLVQYDFSVGERYALDAMWPQD
jgi:hypothetical protein